MQCVKLKQKHENISRIKVVGNCVQKFLKIIVHKTFFPQIGFYINLRTLSYKMCITVYHRLVCGVVVYTFKNGFYC